MEVGKLTSAFQEVLNTLESREKRINELRLLAKKATKHISKPCSDSDNLRKEVELLRSELELISKRCKALKVKMYSSNDGSSLEIEMTMVV